MTATSATSASPRLVPRLIGAIRTRMRSNSLTGVIVAMVVLFVASCFASEHFLTAFNLTIIARSLAFIGLITLAQSMLLVIGELDLSLGAIGGLSGIFGGIMMVQGGFPPALAFVLCILFGLACGCLNGVLVAALKLQSLVLTIGMAGVYGGTILVLTKGVAITDIPTSIAFLGRGTFLGLPTPFVIMLALLGVISFVMAKTPFGRYMYAVGNSLPAAKMLGIAVERVRVAVFATGGALAALAGFLMVARLGTAQPSIGDSWVLAPIAVSVIGGVATTGGVGGPFGAILGAVIIGIIENIIVLFGISPYWQSVVSGGVVVLAISFDSLSRRHLGDAG